MQIDRCRENGVKITHADSHNHIHEEPGLFWLIMRLLQKEKYSLCKKGEKYWLAFIYIKRNI